MVNPCQGINKDREETDPRYIGTPWSLVIIHIPGEKRIFLHSFLRWFGSQLRLSEIRKISKYTFCFLEKKIQLYVLPLWSSASPFHGIVKKYISVGSLAFDKHSLIEEVFYT